MAPPVATARVTPVGRQMGRGAPMYVTFASNPNIPLWEKTTTPGGASMDERKDNSSFHNTKWRTKTPGRLATAEDITVECGYDPDDLQEILDLLGLRDTITLTFATGTTYAFYGWLDAYSFSGHNEDDDPMITLTIAHGNQDWDTCEEEPPVIVAGTGTTTIC